MISDNIFLIIFILLIIGVIVYFYYNYQGDATIPEDNKVVFQKNKKHHNLKYQKSVDKKKMGQKRPNVKYNMKTSRSISNPYSKSQSKSQSKINVDDLFASVMKPSMSPNCSISVTSSFSDDIRNSKVDLTSSNSSNSMTPSPKPSNLEDPIEPEALWDASFGLPLMDEKEKKIFAAKMHQEHKDYTKSLSKFSKYQTDNSTLIKTDITIDPFKPKPEAKSLNGRAIKDIYDEQVSGPKAIPKRIIGKTDNAIIYDSETEMNGGYIKGTNLYGFDGICSGYTKAIFGNDF